MRHKWYKQLFGVGPFGAVISITLFFIFNWFTSIFNQPLILTTENLKLLHGIVTVLIVLGASLHLWSFWTLRTWWNKNLLCIHGPFRYFRHPLYAAWITFIALGVVLYLNSWIFIFWYILLHIVWHKLVTREEKMMLKIFGSEYHEYSARTGRFVPHISFR